MEIKIEKDFKNDLLKRRVVKVIIKSEGNPGFENTKKIIAEKFKADENVIVIKAVRGKFGRDTFLIDAFIYNSVADKGEIEPKPKAKKEAGGQ